MTFGNPFEDSGVVHHSSLESLSLGFESNKRGEAATVGACGKSDLATAGLFPLSWSDSIEPSTTLRDTKDFPAHFKPKVCYLIRKNPLMSIRYCPRKGLWITGVPR